MGLCDKIFRKYKTCFLSFVLLYGCMYIPMPVLDKSGIPKGEIGNIIMKKNNFIISEVYPRGEEDVEKQELTIHKIYISKKNIPGQLTKLTELDNFIALRLRDYFKNHDDRILKDLGFNCNKELTYCHYSSVISIYFSVNHSKKTEIMNLLLEMDSNSEYTIKYEFLFSKSTH